MRRSALYFDCFSGISGDMAIGALLDLGCDEEELRDGLGKLGVEEPFSIGRRRVNRTGITATKFEVSVQEHDSHDHRHRSHREIVSLIESSGLDEGVKNRALAIFARIAAAEAKIHGVAVEEVHFHEVGAIDSIVDVVGVSILLERLAPDTVLSSPVTLGSGTVKTMHGVYPVPAPATLEILRGVPVRAGDVPSELTTPTGAGFLTAVVDQWGTLPEMEITGIGYGAGGKELTQCPDVLRVVMGMLVENAARKHDGGDRHSHGAVHQHDHGR